MNQQDNVRNRTFKEVFEEDVRYEIPFFQRGYAWGKREWDQLFDDIRESIQQDLESGKPPEELEHFFGPIVVLQEEPLPEEPSIKRYSVIDGQQRLTTVYLLLALIKERLEKLNIQSPDALPKSLELRKLLINPIDSRDDYFKMKLFSTKGDRLPTYRALFGSQNNPISPHYHTDIAIYQPGLNQVDAFVAYVHKQFKQNYKDVPSLRNLADILMNSLRIVWIPLDSRKDDPQAIFESLNDKGMPLSSSELICSYLFRPLRSVSDFEQLHNVQWLGALRKFSDRTQFEEYLRYLFSIGEGKTIGKGRRVYVHFKRKHSPLNVANARHELGKISDCADLYRCATSPDEHRHPDTVIHALLLMIKDTRMESCTPFILDVLRTEKENHFPAGQAVAILSETLTMLVRRKMTEGKTTIYDTLFPRLLSQIINEPNPIHSLQKSFQQAGVWTSDTEFREAIIERPLYRSRDQEFCRLVLREIDRAMQSHGQTADYSSMPTIEHIMPQSLDDSWRSYLGEIEYIDDNEHLKNTLGNLCLASTSANSSYSNNPFETKLESYSDVTALVRDVRANHTGWDFEDIKNRSNRLAEVAVLRWRWSQ